MSSTPLDFKYVYKRKRCLENSNESSLTESMTYIPDLSKISSPILYKQKVEQFFSECHDYKAAIKMLEDLYQTDNFNLLESGTQSTIQYIIPTIPPIEIKDCISFIKESSLGDIEKDRLLETTKMYKSIDRILKNHKNLSKRFKLTELGRIGSVQERCDRICKMVDSYNLTNFIKFNICLEELSFLSYKDGLNISEEEISENVTNYFLLRDSNTYDDIKSYKEALIESKVISDKKYKSLSFLIEGKYLEGNYWNSRLNRWKLDPKKNITTITEIAKDNLDDIDALNTILYTIDEFVNINELDFDIKEMINSIKEVNGSEARNILNIIKESNIESPEDIIFDLNTIWETDINNIVYDDGTEIPETFTSNEIDKFKLHNIALDAQEVGEFLDQLEKTSMKETPLNIEIGEKVSASVEDINESNLINYIDSNGYISKKIRNYKYIGSVEEAYKLLDSSIKCLNNILYNNDTKAFYTLREDTFDIWIRSKYKVLLSENQEKIKMFSDFDKKALCDIGYFTEVLEEISNSPLSSIIEKLNDREYAAEVSIDEASLVFDILNPYLDKDGSTLKGFINLCREEANPRFDRIRESLESIKPEEFNIYDNHTARIELCADLMGIAYTHEDAIGNLKNAVNDAKKGVNKVASKIVDKTSDNKSEIKSVSKDLNSKNLKEKEDLKEKENNKTSEDDNKELSPEAKKKSINSLNDIKLVWQGVKAKAKNASAKEQEISRDLDMEFNHLCKTIQSTYGRDYREEIITGEINRSLSKIIKIAISLAGLGLATAGITGSALIAPAIGAIMLFVKSKHTSTKEKKMILDEIDIELQVLEREINRAEQSGSTKKYRQLLTIQKNLQRRRQEIYYDLGKRGTKVPMQSTTGLRPRE